MNGHCMAKHGKCNENAWPTHGNCTHHIPHTAFRRTPPTVGYTKRAGGRVQARGSPPTHCTMLRSSERDELYSYITRSAHTNSDEISSPNNKSHARVTLPGASRIALRLPRSLESTHSLQPMSPAIAVATVAARVAEARAVARAVAPAAARAAEERGAARAEAATAEATAAAARAYTGETILSGRVRRSMSCRASSRMSRNLIVTSSAHRSRGISSVEPSFVARSRHVLGPFAPGIV